jgi:hypothetical protein
VDGDERTPDVDPDGSGEDLDEPLSPFALSARGFEDPPRTVEEVANVHPFQTKKRLDARRHGLGGLLGELSGVAAVSRPKTLTVVRPTAPQSEMRFPDGFLFCTVDSAGRIKPHFPDGRLSDLFGWRGGVLDSVLVDGWLRLSQPADCVGRPRGRCNERVGFTVASTGIERVCLRPAHLSGLGIRPGVTLFVAPILDEQTLVIVNPGQQLAAHAPAHVRTLLGEQPSATVTTLHAVADAGTSGTTRKQAHS